MTVRPEEGILEERTGPTATLSKRAWHSLPRSQVLAELNSGDSGLTSDEAATRLRTVGPNVLPEKATRSLPRILLAQCKSPLIYILFAAAAISMLIDEQVDAMFIGAVLVLNAAIGGIQEWRAQQTAQALQNLLKIRVPVIRSGRQEEIDAHELVPGDLILLESGQRVPADLRLLETTALQIDEAPLTGESLPVTKAAEWLGPEQTPLPERANIAHAGSAIARGRGRGVVVETGTRTVVGRLALDVVGVRGGRPPLVARMNRFARVVAVVVLLAGVLLILVGTLVLGIDPTQMLLTGIALTVSAIPEGLPIAMSVALAISSQRMARRGVIVRRLAAVEGLGSCTLIATDKTGTLTRNELTVTRVLLPDETVEIEPGGRYRVAVPGSQTGVDDSPIPPKALDRFALAATLCNEAELRIEGADLTGFGDGVDVAFLVLGSRLGKHGGAALKELPRVSRIPFEPEQQYAASFHREGTGTRVFVKGSPERLASMTTLSEEELQPWFDRALALAEQGYRLIAVAEGYLDSVVESDSPPELTRLQLLGIAGMIDPLREGAREAVITCRRAGIQVLMLTGDHRGTALAIARELGLAYREDEARVGHELDNLAEADFRRTVLETKVFARVTPQQKLRIVEAARQLGHFVAVTGDGVNDAPALRAANLGVAMGKKGTDVAREAADLIISDDNFATVVAGVEEGRVAYDNIRKVIFLLISTGAAEIVLVLLAVGAGLPIPLLPVQLLWLNLVTNGIQDVALAFEPKEDDVLLRKPRSPNEGIFDRLMIERTLVAALFIGGVSFGTFHALIASGASESEARNAVLLLMVLFENIHIMNCRSETRSAFAIPLRRSPVLIVGVVCAFGVHVVSMHLPLMQRVLKVEPISLDMWLVLSALALTVLFPSEFQKYWRRRKIGATNRLKQRS